MPKVFRYAAVDGPSNDKLKVVAVFDWDGPLDPFSVMDDRKKATALMRRAGLSRLPKVWVEVGGRPDVAVGEPYPIMPRPEPAPILPPEPSAPAKPVAPVVPTAPEKH